MGTFTSTVSTPVAATGISASWGTTVAQALNAFGAWTSYTPTLTVFTPGNGTATGAYCQVEKLVMFRLKFTFGSTSAAASGVPTFTLPVTAKSSDLGQDFDGWFENTGVAKYRSNVYLASASTISMGINGTSGLSQSLSTTTPFTWATGSNIYAFGTYEAA